MGLRRTKIEFEDKLPSTELIKNRFKNITGLNLMIVSDLNLTQLESESLEITNLLLKNISDVKAYRKEAEAIEEKVKNDDWNFSALEKLDHVSQNFIGISYFFHPLFYELRFEVKANCISIDSLLNNFYFKRSIDKVLLDLGGKLKNYESKEAEEKYSTELLKLKQWTDYSWYNCPRK